MEINGESKDKNLDAEIFNLKLSTLERRIDENTLKVVEKLGEMVTEMRLLRESLLTAALGVMPRQDSHIMAVLKPIFSTLLWVIGIMVLWFTGLREVLPKLAP